MIQRVTILCLLAAGILSSRGLAQNSSPEKLLQKALRFQKEGAFEQSSLLLQEAIPGFETAKEWAQAAGCYNDLSFNAKSLYRLHKAEQFAHKVLKLTESHDIPPVERLSAYHNLGLIETERGDFENAMNWFKKGLVISEKAVIPAQVTAGLIAGIGSVHHELGNFERAMREYKRGIQMLNPDHPDHQKQLATLYNYTGVTHVSKGQFDRALRFYLKELKISKVLYGKHHPNVAGIYNNLGGLRYRSGDIGKAIDYFEQAAQSFKKSVGNNHPGLAMTYNNLGACYFQLDNLEQSVTYLEKSLQIRKKNRGPEHPDLAIGYNNIGGLYLELKEYKKAEQYLKNSLSIRKKSLGANHPDLTNTYSTLGNLFLRKGKTDSAIYYFEREVKITQNQRGKNHPYVADALNNIAISNRKQRFFDLALSYHQQALKVLAKNFDSESYTVNPTVSGIRYPNYAVNVLYEKGKTLQASYRQDNNLETLKAGLSTYVRLSELVDYLQKGFQSNKSKLLTSRESHKMYEHGIETAHQLYKQTHNPKYLNQAFYFAEKSKTRVILELIKTQEAKKFAGIPDSLISYENRLRSRITKINQRIKDSLKASPKDIGTNRLRDSLFVLNQTLDEHLHHIEKKYPRYHNLKYNKDIPSIPSIQQKLRSQNLSLIEYFHGNRSSWAFVMDGRKLEVISLPYDSSLTKHVRQFRQSIIQPSDSLYLALGSELYKKLLKPVTGRIQNSNILFVPDGVLNLLPFETLLTHEIKENQEQTDYSKLPYVINKFTVSYSPSTTLFALPGRNEDQDFEGKFAAFAPGFNVSEESINTREAKRHEQWPPIPSTNHEVQQIAKLFEKNSGFWAVLFGSSAEPSLFLEKDATEKTFKTENIGKYKYLHLATHAFASDTGSHRSGIVFYQKPDDNENNILYSEEIYNLNLQAKLLVLSACETGTGKVVRGEGILGLSRAFRYAGVKNLLVSLWKVDDRSTARLMINFYKNHLDGNSFGQSLRKAKQSLKNHPGYAHPRYWAPFVFIEQ